MVELTQQNFEKFIATQVKLVDTLNHRVTNMEIDLKWMKRIGYYMAGIITAIATKLIIFN